MTALDHVVVLARDLDLAAPAWTRLGFRLTPRGRHQALGTANHTAVFERDYLELLTVERPTRGGRRFSELLERGEGLGTVALATDDADALAATLAERGVPAVAPMVFGRPVVRGNEPVEARFTVSLLEPEASPAIPAFFCQHHTRDLVWLPEYRHHPNTATGIAGITVSHDDPDALVPAYERLLGSARVRPRPGGIALMLGSTQVWVVRHDYAEARLERKLPDAARPIGLTVSVADLAKARRYLLDTGVPYRAFGRRSVLVEPTFTHGVFLELLAG